MASRLSDALRVLNGAVVVARAQFDLLHHLRGSISQILVRTGGPHVSSDRRERDSGAKDRRRGFPRDGSGSFSSREEKMDVETVEETMRKEMRDVDSHRISAVTPENTVVTVESDAANEEQTKVSPKKGENGRARTDPNPNDIKFKKQESPLTAERPFVDRRSFEREGFRATLEEGEENYENKAFTWEARERRVPESPLARLMGFGSLAAGLAFGAASEGARRFFGSKNGVETSSNPNGSSFMTDANAERLANSLSRMRGAALKLGQMLSMQDERLVPPQVLKALERVRQGADVMPQSQLERVISGEFGAGDWKVAKNVENFDPKPIAAASIGQVHKATYRDPKTNTPVDIAMKIQYPGVGNSIGSDISNLKRLAKYTKMFPDSMYLDEALMAAKEELERECNYLLEAENQTRFRSLIMNDEETKHDFIVPSVIRPLTTKHILTSDFVEGIPIDRVVSTAQRQKIANMILKLTLRELFIFRFMQTDPNFSNFLYDQKTDKIMLVDHGATREFGKNFVSNYLRLIQSCAYEDREGVLFYSTELGFLIGEESKVMLDAHVAASIAVGEPFQKRYLGGYSFKNSDIAVRTAQLGRTMLRERLCPPPKEAYSLHRRLSGAFLMCGRLGATVDAASMLEKTLASFPFESDATVPISQVGA
eukprot:Plantae.Rhodophyta-Hildenbrandia_rubra.ctg17934.p1 GENE.Plantae.Rhodophyta-Hildenbrandia_rubra.ctg17934~~Plantae.Rhodophyta-Hildenbrandia_rubra.ctg17934.p1  ORF type:complete len:655 (-),score=132.60 Plantae.Rhodophyta-Hildenbrandia_rubra.ctg17934:1066-3030(-)